MFFRKKRRWRRKKNREAARQQKEKKRAKAPYLRTRGVVYDREVVQQGQVPVQIQHRPLERVLLLPVQLGLRCSRPDSGEERKKPKKGKGCVEGREGLWEQATDTMLRPSTSLTPCCSELSAAAVRLRYFARLSSASIATAANACRRCCCCCVHRQTNAKLGFKLNVNMGFKLED